MNELKVLFRVWVVHAIRWRENNSKTGGWDGVGAKAGSGQANDDLQFYAISLF
jgi:hypothetical protein